MGKRNHLEAQEGQKEAIVGTLRLDRLKKHLWENHETQRYAGSVCCGREVKEGTQFPMHLLKCFTSAVSTWERGYVGEICSRDTLCAWCNEVWELPKVERQSLKALV